MRLTDEQCGRAYSLPFGLYAKYGTEVTRAEAMATEFVQANTTIPVPKILDVLEDNDHVMILMTRLPGEPFFDHFDYLSPADVDIMKDTLRDWLHQLRMLPSPTQSVCRFGGGPCKSHRVRADETFGPFDSIRDLHDYLYTSVPKKHQDRLHVLAEASHSRPHKICFTHGDIAPSNILISGNRLTGLIDWECAGWFPEYWDFTTAVYRRQRYPEWFNLFKDIFPQYETELEVELAFWAVDFPW
jgi:aminoglycoside phosphotransferase (APT) family kinase protein